MTRRTEENAIMEKKEQTRDDWDLKIAALMRERDDAQAVFWRRIQDVSKTRNDAAEIWRKAARDVDRQLDQEFPDLVGDAHWSAAARDKSNIANIESKQENDNG